MHHNLQDAHEQCGKKDTEITKVLFINDNPNRSENTAVPAKVDLNGREADQIDLPGYHIHFYASKMECDLFEEMISRVKAADVILPGHFYGPKYEGIAGGRREANNPA